MSGLIGKKLGMARIFDAQGKNVGVTLIEAGPCLITQLKKMDKDGYEAIQLGFEDKKEKHTTKPEAGHFAKASVAPKRFVREFTDFEQQDSMKPGDTIKVDLFKEGEIVDVIGWSKGKGFQGVVKRHHFKGGPKTHGQSDRTRAPGSVGSSSFPSRVYKGLRMAGRMGNQQVTSRNVMVVRVLPDKNIIMVKGSVPGPKTGLVLIKK